MIHQASYEEVLQFGGVNHRRGPSSMRRPLRSGGGGSAAFTPASLGPSAWLDDRDQTLVAGPKISDWGDQSAGGTNDFSQGTDALRFTTTTINGVASANATGSLYEDATTNILTFASATAWTIYWVGYPTSVNAGSGTNGSTCDGIWGQSSSGYYGFGLQQDGVGGYRAVHSVYDTAYRTATSANGSITLNTTTLIVARLTATVQLRVGASPNVVGAATTGVPVAGRTQGHRLAANYNATESYRGRYGTLLVFASHIADGSADDLNIRTYLSNKYGCTV